jgi:hypothetical protein
MASSTLVHDSSPVGRDIVFIFSTIQDYEPLDFSALPGFTVYVYDGSAGGSHNSDELLITTLISSVDTDLFFIDEDNQVLSVTIPWDSEAAAGSLATGIVQYNPDFKGEIYAQLIIDFPEEPVGARSADGQTPQDTQIRIQNTLNHTKKTVLHTSDQIRTLQNEGDPRVWSDEERAPCYSNLGPEPPNDISTCTECIQNHISLMPLRVKYLQGSCSSADSNLRFKLILAAQWMNSISCEAYRAYHRVTVRTFRSEDITQLPVSTAHSQFAVHAKPDEADPPITQWGGSQLVSVSPMYPKRSGRIEGIPVPNVDNKDAWVVVDIDAPITWLGGNLTSLWGGNCWCEAAAAPCACPGLVGGCGQDPTRNLFLDSPHDVYPWEAPTDDSADSCCTGCGSSSQIPATRDYVGCETMYKGPSACTGNTLPDTTPPYWSQSYLYKCGKSFNFWIKAHDYG